MMPSAVKRALCMDDRLQNNEFWHADRCYGSKSVHSVREVLWDILHSFDARLLFFNDIILLHVYSLQYMIRCKITSYLGEHFSFNGATKLVTGLPVATRHK